MTSPTVNDVQELQFQRMEASSYTSFNGELVAQDLRENTDLWKGVVWGRFAYSMLLPLRDIATGHYNADTLIALVPTERLSGFLTLSEAWHAQEATWTDGRHQHGNVDLSPGEFTQASEIIAPGFVVVRLWWD